MKRLPLFLTMTLIGLLAGCKTPSQLVAVGQKALSNPQDLAKTAQELSKLAQDLKKTVDSAYNGQLVPPPQLDSQRLQAVFVNGLNGQPPSLADVTKMLGLTSGALAHLLPAEPGMNSGQIEVTDGASAFGVLGGNFRPLATRTVTVGFGVAPPKASSDAELADTRDDDNAPIFVAKPGVSGKYGLLATPDVVDLRPQFPAIRDQGQRGTCVLFASAGILDFLYANNGQMPIKHASPQFMNWLYQLEVKSKLPANIRAKLWTDNGTFPALFFPVLSVGGNREVSEWMPYVPPSQGYLSEEEVPYNQDHQYQTPETDLTEVAGAHLGKPLVDKIAAKQTLTSQGAFFFRIKADAESFEAALAEGKPIFICYPLYGDEWFKPHTYDKFRIPEMTPEKAKDEAKIGYHAVVIVGYERDASAPGGGWFIIRNSWGDGWGEQGHCRVSYKYTFDYSYDSHVAQAYEQPFKAKYSLQAPPNDPPPIEEVVKDTPVPKPNEVNGGEGYTENNENSQGVDINKVEESPEPEPTETPEVEPSSSPTPDDSPSPSPTASPTPTPSPSRIPLPDGTKLQCTIKDGVISCPLPSQ